MKYKYNGQWNELNIKALDSLEIGTIVAFGGTTIPYGWLECNGASITQSAYPELYALIGGTLPNFKGRVLVGQDTNDSDFNSMFETGGSKYLQEHNHVLGKSAGAGSQTDWAYTVSNVSNAGTVSTQNAGIGDAGNLQPYSVVKWIIKALNSTPTMASVVNATNNSTEDTYSCDYINNYYGGVVLYNDTTGTTGNVSLNETTANFKYIEIYAVDNDSRTSYFNIFKFNASSSTFNLYGSSVNANGYAIFTSLYTNNGTTLTNGGHYLYNGSISSYPIFRVVKVIGYK